MGWPAKIFLRQRPADAVTIFFLLVLLTLTFIFYRSIPKAPLLIGTYSSLLVIQAALASVKHGGRSVIVLHRIVFPVICVLVVFDSLGNLVHYINPVDIDPILIRIDYMICGNHPTVLLERITNPALTDLLQIAYTSYYFIPISFGVLLFKKNRHREFDRSVFLILLCFYLSYLGYMLFPALGPRFSLAGVQTMELRGLLVTEPLQRFLNHLEDIKRDAFPSGHTAVTVLVLCLAYRYHKGYFRIAFPVVSALVFATVYCRYHYVVDVLAGLALTALTLLLGDRYYARWEQRQSVPAPAEIEARSSRI